MTPEQARRLAESALKDGPAPDRAALAQALLEALDDIAAHEEALAVQVKRVDAFDRLASRRLETACEIQAEVETLEHSVADAMEQIEAIQGSNAVHMARITEISTMGDKVAESYLAETRMTTELRKIIVAREAELKAVCDELGKMKLAYEMSEALRNGPAQETTDDT